MISDFGYILLFIISGIVLLALVFAIAKFIRPNRPYPEKLSTYESGEEPTGNANVQFNIRYYIVALVFILFEVELVFLFPWATVFGNQQLFELTDGLWAWVSVVEMFIFIGLLILGLAYAWVKGYLEWVKPEIKVPDYQSNIPKSAYEKYLS
ncbi:MAG: NADH-quinone oxidoreductase subunit A [Bacteroidota bacterium]